MMGLGDSIPYDGVGRSRKEQSKDCPYGAESCPKLHEYAEKLEHMESRQRNMERILYIIAGLVLANLGISIW